MPARDRTRGRGQSLVEFALILPLLLVLLAFGLDLGRVFLGWVNLNNSVKVAATYAAQNPNAWVSGTPNARTIEYQRLVTADADVINCDMPSPIPSPTFPSGRDIGDPAKVAVTCRFHLITPILSFVLGNGLDVSASSAFPIRSGVINGIPVQTAIPIADAEPDAQPVAVAIAVANTDAGTDRRADTDTQPVPNGITDADAQPVLHRAELSAPHEDADKAQGTTGPGAGFVHELGHLQAAGSAQPDYNDRPPVADGRSHQPCATAVMTVGP